MKRRLIGKKTADPAADQRITGTDADSPPQRKAVGTFLRPDPGGGSLDDEVLHHLSSLLDSVKTGIISLDGEGRVRVFNAVAEALFAVHRQAVLGRPFSALGRLINFKEHSIQALWERLADAGWAAGAALYLEDDLVRSAGQKSIISYSVYPLGRLAWSVGHGVVIMLEDVTRKKELEDQITDGRKRLQTVFDGITDGIQVVDKGFRITAVNKSMTILVSGVVTLGQLCYKACSFGDAPCGNCPVEATFRTGQPASVIKRSSRRSAIRTAADERVLEISSFPLLDRSGRVVQVVEYIKDVTDRIRLAERLEHTRRLAELGEMAARVAHEVRNPLNAINGAAHFLATEYANDEIIEKFTSLIKRQSGRIDQVASDILYAAKPLRLARTSVDVDAVVDQVLAALGEEIQGQGISVVRRAAPDLPRLQADELQIEQALTNIIQNAVESMPSGGTLSIGTAEDAAGGWLRISVQDTGSGIRPEDRDHIFQTFFTTKAKGTGLGLSIVEGVLKNHGGKIFIEQPEGAGTRVVLCLPAGGNGSIAGPENPDRAFASPPESTPKKIP